MAERSTFRFRPPESGDVDSLLGVKNSPDVASLLIGEPRTYSRGDIEEWITFHRSAPDEALFVIADSTDRAVGHVGLYRIDLIARSAEFGILIGDPSAWGKGLGWEAARFVLNHGFGEIGLRTIHLEVLATNERAIRLYRSLGFSDDERIPGAHVRAGRPVDILRMSLAREVHQMQGDTRQPAKPAQQLNSISVELIGADSDEWSAILGRISHDVYHLPSYAALAGQRERGDVSAVVVRESGRTMLLPIVLRPIPEGSGSVRDAISPYGYPGPLFGGDPDPAFVARASLAMVDRLRKEGIVSLFVRTHPLLNADVTGLDSAGAIVEHGETVWIDLTASVEEQWSGTRPRDRSYINGAIRAGQRAYLDDRWLHEATFVELYASTMQWVGAGPEYMFDANYVRALKLALGSRLHLCVVDIDGSIAAAGLFTEEDGIVQYHLSGTDETFAQARPTKLMLHFVRGLMKERGNRVMNLGGGLGAARDSLFDFKAGFSKWREPFRTWRVVVDPERYADLSRERQPDKDPDDLSGYFPLYRRALD